MKKYTEIMEHIKPTPEQKDRMLEKALQGKPERKRFKLRYAAAVVAAGVIFSGTVFGEEIKNTFYGLLGRDEIVSEQVLNDVFTDSDGHVTVAVKEVLSDKINAYAIVEYTALDSEGQDWLDNSLIVNMNNAPNITPDWESVNAVYGGSFSYGFEEIENLRTDKSRVFKTVYDSSGENFGTDSIRFWYCLTNDWGKETSIDVTESVQLTDIKFDSSKAPDKYYKPLGAKLSPLSLMIYGKDMGMTETGKTKSGGYYQKVVHEEEIDSLYLIMKDGTIYNMLKSESMDMGQCGYTLTHVSNPEVGYDCAIYTGAFKESVDISLIDGIELDGVYYPLGL